MEPIFLTTVQVLEIHRDQIERYGGSHGLRESNLLESALAIPSSTFGGEFLHSDMFEMAASYLFHLTQNHPFVDGNKRIGAATAFVFLRMNGLRLIADQDEYAELVLSVARGELQKPQIAEFLRNHSRTV